MLVLKQNTANSVPTPPAGKGTIFLTDQDDLAVKTNDGNVTTFPTVGGTNTQVFFNDDGGIGANANLTFNKATQVLTVTGNVTATGVKTDNLYYANGNPWDLSDPGGSNTQVQFNDDESFGGSANLTFNKSTNTLVLSGTANVADFNATGNAVIGGNLTVNGNVTYVNVETLSVEDPIISIGGGANGAPLTSDDGKDRGTALQYYSGSAKTAFMGWDNSNAEFGLGSVTTVANDVVTFTTYGNLRAGNVIATGASFSANVTALGLLTDNLYYANGNPWDLSDPGGSNTQIQFNDDESFGGSSAFTFDKSSNLVTLTGGLYVNANNAVRVGPTANLISYPKAQIVSSWGTSGVTSGMGVGVVGEGTGQSGDPTLDVAGLAGVGVVNGAGRATGVIGSAYVSNTNDTGAAAGMRAYSVMPHTGGYNIGFLGNAANGGSGSYAFYVQQGNIASIETNTVWDLYDNSATAFGFNSTGKSGILAISTADAAEGVSMSGTLSVTGNANVGNLGTAALVVTGNVTGNLLPSANVTYNLGSDTQRWNELYLAGNTIKLGNQQISSNTTSITLSGNINGDGSGLANLNASNVSSGTLSNARLSGTYSITVDGSANTVRDAAQANITSLGTLTGLGVNGNIVAVNVSANTGIFSGNAAGLTNIPAGNLSGQVANALVAGTVYTNAQPNITSVGTLSSLAVTGNATAGNVSATGDVSGATLSGSLTTASQPNVTSLGTLSSLAVTGNIAAGNVYANSGTIGASVLTGSLSTAAQPNITSVGTLSSLSVTANVAAGNLTTTGVLSVTGTGVSSIAGNLDMTSNTIINLATPTNPSDAATKQYVDDVAQGLNIHDSCAAATPDTLANVTSGTITYNNGTGGVNANLVTTGSFNLIDGVNVQTSGTRILVKNEANAAHNGIYTWANSTTIVRATDFNSVPEVEAGDFTFVTGGTLYDNTGWVQTATVTTIGTDNIEFTQFSGAGTYQAGTGLTLTGSTFSVNASQSQITSVGTLDYLAVSNNITSNMSIYANSGTVGASLLTGTLTTNAQPNVTSLGTLSSLSVTGNIDCNASIGGASALIIGNGSSLTALNASNITSGTLAQARLANSSLTVNGTSISLGGSGTITANTTQTLTLGSYLTGTSFNGGTAVTAAVDATPNNTASKVVARDGSGNFSAGTITATLSGAATTAGTVTTAAQPNITSVGTLTSLTVSGNITSTGGFFDASVNAAVSAAGTAQGNATVIASEINVVSTVASGAGVALPSGLAGIRVTLINTAANALLVYPASGGQINSLGTNASYSLPASGRLEFVCTSATQWYTLNATYG